MLEEDDENVEKPRRWFKMSKSRQVEEDENIERKKKKKKPKEEKRGSLR